MFFYAGVEYFWLDVVFFFGGGEGVGLCHCASTPDNALRC